MTPESASNEPADLVFYRLLGCPHCERVANALNECDLTYRSRCVYPYHSDRDAVKRISGHRSVPVLVDRRADLVLTESANIVQYLAATYNDGAPLEMAVTTLPPAEHVAEGETAPDFTRPFVTADYWEDRSLSELVGDAPLMLVFTPMDQVGRTRFIWNDIKTRRWGEPEGNVIGVSPSSPYEHRALIARSDLPYPLFSDPSNEIADRYGVAHDFDGMAGVRGPRPAVFVIDDDRVVQYAWVASRWPQSPDYDAIEDAVDTLR